MTYFRPRALLNLALLDTLDSLAPVLDAKVRSPHITPPSCPDPTACLQLADVGQQDSPQLYSVCGRGATSSLRVLQHGLQVAEMAASELPGNPSAIWSVKRHVDGTCRGLVWDGMARGAGDDATNLMNNPNLTTCVGLGTWLLRWGVSFLLDAIACWCSRYGKVAGLAAASQPQTPLRLP